MQMNRVPASTVPCGTPEVTGIGYRGWVYLCMSLATLLAQAYSLAIRENFESSLRRWEKMAAAAP